MKSARRNASGEFRFSNLGDSSRIAVPSERREPRGTPPQSQNKCQTKPALSPCKPRKTDNQRPQQVTIFRSDSTRIAVPLVPSEAEGSESAAADEPRGALEHVLRISTRQCCRVEFAVTLTKQTVGLISTRQFFGGVFCTLCDRICLAKGPGATFKSLRCGVYFPPFSVARYARGGQ